MTKAEWMEMWHLSGEEGERCWQEKQRMDEKSFKSHMIMPDLQPYKSMVTGEMIEGRKAHKEHLKQHRMIEIGNEGHHLKPKPYEPAPGLKQRLWEVANSKLH